MTEQSVFTSVGDHHYIALTTFRKSGKPVMTPVWFVKESDRLIIWTAKDSGKAKRLRNNPCAELGLSDHSGKLLGPVAEGVARFVPENEYSGLKKAFQTKYSWQERLFSLFWKIKGQQHTYIEFTSTGSSIE